MNKLKIVVKHEFLRQIRSKGFIVMTIIAPVILIAFGMLPVLIKSLNTAEHTTVAVSDESGRMQALLPHGDSASIRYEFVATPISATAIDSLKAIVNAKKLHGYARIRPAVVDDKAAK